MLIMKMTLKIRSFFQLLTFLSVLMIFGAAGAWENGVINFLQFLIETAMFLGAGCFFARLSKRRIAFHLFAKISAAHQKRTRPDAAPQAASGRTVHAA